MSAFWNIWIIGLSVLNVAAMGWLIWWSMRIPAGDSKVGDVTGHSWDGLEEYNNPLPRWWLYLFFITLAFAVLYYALYPGLGNYKGVFGWTKEGQYDQEVAGAKKKYDPIFKKYAAVPVADLATGSQYEEARAMGRRMYLSYCSQCHGSTATGAPGFPNLADNAWVWGGSPDQIKSTILDGRNGTPARGTGMPPMGAALGAGVDDMVQYVMSLSGRKHNAESAARAKPMFAVCGGCHGMDGKGNPALGAPNLTDKAWIFGGSPGTIKKTIMEGRKGVMPAHKDFLGEEKVHLLAAYVKSLSAKK